MAKLEQMISLIPQKQFRLKFVQLLGSKCSLCNSTKNIIIHHRDKNREHNNFSNLQLLCKSCHAKEHKMGSHFPHLGKNRDNQKRLTTSFKIDEDVWRLAKIEAATEDIGIGEWLEQLILKELKSE